MSASFNAERQAAADIHAPTMPHSPEVEQWVLGGLLIDNSSLGRVNCAADDFYNQEHSRIFSAIKALVNAGTPADIITVFEYLKASGDVVDLPFLNALSLGVTTAVNMRAHSEIVRKHSGNRRLAALLELVSADVLNANGKTAAQILGSHEDAFKQLSAKATQGTHPLALYVDLDDAPVAPRYVIPRFIGHGLTVIAGAHGVGKTTALLPLSMVAAGLHAHGDPLAPKHWRHVAYITEDVEQARRIVAGVVKFGALGLDTNTVRERLHLVEARRLDPSYVAQVATIYREQFARTVDDVDIPPLVVLDTKSAVFSIEEENSNSEASAIVAMLKQSFESLPVWLVGHVAKANLSRGDVAGLTLRGASAFEADANQVLYLVAEGESRFLVRGKTRFEAAWPELHIQSKTASTVARDEFGDLQQITLRWGIATPPEQSRAEAREQAQEAANKADAVAMRQEVRDAVEAAWQGGFPLNRAGVKAKVKRRGDDVGACIENLLSERWLHEVCVPAKQRVNNSRSSFFVNFTTEEHEAVIRGEGLPAMKLQIPESWTKPPIPVVPEVVTEAGTSENQMEAA